MERVLDDAADQLRREEVGEFRGEGRGEGVEVGALVGSEVARRAHFLQVNVAPRPRHSSGEGGARAKQNQADASVPQDVIQRSHVIIISHVHRGTFCDE